LCALGAVMLVVAIPVARAAPASVSIQGFAFNPSGVTISAGETVTWTQKDAGTQHTATADDDSWGSQALSTGSTFSHTFAQAGTFTYHCAIHSSMHGTVTVMGSAPAPTSPPPTAAPAPPVGGPVATAAPAAQTAAPTTVRPTTTLTTAPTTTAPTTTVPPPPVVADQGGDSATTTTLGGVALPAQKTSSSDDDLNPALVVLAIALAACAAGGTFFVRRREGQPSG